MPKAAEVTQKCKMIEHADGEKDFSAITAA